MLSVVLDLDETLIHCPAQQPPEAGGLDHFVLGDGSVVLLRPGYYEFLDFLGGHFDAVYVYTAATPVYAGEVVKVLFNNVPLRGAWSRPDCELGAAGGVYKSLRDKRSPDGEVVDSPYTAVVDDRPDVTERNVYARGENHFVVPPFTGNPADNALLGLQQRLMEWVQRRRRGY